MAIYQKVNSKVSTARIFLDATFWFACLLHIGSGQMPNLCFDCTNYLGGTHYSFCPKDANVDMARAKPLPCNGTCFTRGSSKDERVVVRGCSSTVGNLPMPPPEDGCYDHENTTVCICSRPLCNIGAMGKSSGVSLTAHLINMTNLGNYPDDEEGVLYCHQCNNYDLKGNYYPQCPRDSVIIPQRVYSGNCTGKCFTRTRSGDAKSVYRGCTDSQYALPFPLPPDGCYNWNDDVYCLCSTSRCNRQAMATEWLYIQISYNFHYIDYLTFSYITIQLEEDGIKRCFDCSNYDLAGKYYPQCPKQSRVRNAYMSGCNGTCFTRSYHNNASKVTRGCTQTQYGLPYPLPPDGCYNWNDDVWCLCSGSRCNRDAMEEDGIKKCFQCINYDTAGNYYRQCPKNARVRNAYLGACNGTCFTRSYDYNASLVARGCSDSQYGLPDPLPPDGCYKYCSDSQYGLPDPLPPDGCYKWYSEVWCVCSTSRCNGEALGEPQDIEFDAHIDKGN
ncbi:hypothetical protein EGW08_008979, partial [Elysia chlorotica]